MEALSRQQRRLRERRARRAARRAAATERAATHRASQKFNCTVRQHGRGFHVGVNARTAESLGAALRAAAIRVANLIKDRERLALSAAISRDEYLHQKALRNQDASTRAASAPRPDGRLSLVETR